MAGVYGRVNNIFPKENFNFFLHNCKENFQMPANQPLNKGPNRAFGKDISNLIQKNPINNQQEQKKNVGRSLSVNMSKSMNQSFKAVNKLDESRVNDRDKSRILYDVSCNSQDLEKCDQEAINLPSSVAVYAKEIFEYLQETQNKFLSKGGYMSSNQNDINEKMRGILIDWLVDVHIKFKLRPETLFLTVNLIDRYLEKVTVHRQKLQLVGVASMLIACKYEEIYAPETKDFVFVTDKAYTKEEIHDMEGKILLVLDFNLTTTSSLRFLERYARLSEVSDKGLWLAKYILELCLVDYKMLKYEPNILASSGLYLSNKILKKNQAWNETLEKNSTYTENELRICAKDLFVLLQNAEKNSLQAIKRKYSDPKFLSVSRIQLEKL